MTNESSIDSTRQGHEVSPRRAAREARRRAEALAQGLEAPLPGSESALTPDSAASPSSAPSAPSPAEAPEVPAATAEPTAEELETRAQRSRSFAAAQRASSEGASRARREAMEAQRAAAERVRETLRANAVGPRRAARSASALTADSAATAASASSAGSAVAEESPAKATSVQNFAATSAAPFDQNALDLEASKAPSAAQATIRPPADAPAPAQAPAQASIASPTPQTSRPSQRPGAQTPASSGQWDARNHETMSFSDILASQDETKAPPMATKAAAPSPFEAPAPVDSGTPGNSSQAAKQVAAAEHAQQITAEPVEHPEPAEIVSETSFHDDSSTVHENVEHYELEDTYPVHAANAQYVDDSYYAAAEIDDEDPQARENVFLTGSDELDPNTARKTRKRRRNGVMAVVLLGFIGVIVAVVLILQGVLAKFNPEDYPGPGGEAVSFEVMPGWGTNQISKHLVADDIVASEKLFAEAVQLVETDNREIHPGVYELRKQMPSLDAATILIGDGLPKVGYVAIKQNVRMPAVLEEVAKGSGLPLKDLQKLANDPKAFGIKSEAKNLEGYLHPGEYRFPVDSDAKSVLQMLVDATQKSLKDQGITDPAEGYRALKIASILQAEARPNDYAVVAGALENRLHPNNTETNGLLQVDSTVIYGLDRYTLQISKAEKTDAGNLYNSYVHKGLPPTPIGSPGDSAIKAAANPEANSYYYWVTVNTNTGETKFAKTYREHLVNQNEFRAWCAQNTDVCK